MYSYKGTKRTIYERHQINTNLNLFLTRENTWSYKYSYAKLSFPATQSYWPVKATFKRMATFLFISQLRPKKLHMDGHVTTVRRPENSSRRMYFVVSSRAISPDTAINSTNALMEQLSGSTYQSDSYTVAAKTPPEAWIKPRFLVKHPHT